MTNREKALEQIAKQETTSGGTAGMVAFCRWCGVNGGHGPDCPTAIARDALRTPDSAPDGVEGQEVVEALRIAAETMAAMGDDRYWSADMHAPEEERIYASDIAKRLRLHASRLQRSTSPPDSEGEERDELSVADMREILRASTCHHDCRVIKGGIVSHHPDCPNLFRRAPTTGGGEREALEERLARLADSGTLGGGLALANHEVETLRNAVTALRDIPCDCWREAMNMHRHGRDWRLACSCLDHPEEERCDCPFCAALASEPATERRFDEPRVAVALLAFMEEVERRRAAGNQFDGEELAEWSERIANQMYQREPATPREPQPDEYMVVWDEGEIMSFEGTPRGLADAREVQQGGTIYAAYAVQPPQGGRER